MGEIWAVALGAASLAIGAAGTAYSITSSNAAINAANSVKPPKFVPINPEEVNKMAVSADTAGYATSDKDFAQRFPLLAAGRTYSIGSALASLENRPSKSVTDALAKTGIATNIQGNPFKQAISLGQPILAKEQRDRSYLARLLGDNPQRQFGLSGGDVANIAVANTNSANNFNQGLYGSNINLYNAQVQQNAQNFAAASTGATGLLNVGASLYNNNISSYLNSDYYRTRPITFGPDGQPVIGT